MASTIVEILLKAKDQASKTLEKVSKEMNGLNKAANNANGGTAKFADTWSEAMLGINQGIMIAQQAAEALKRVYETAREGAALEYAENRFDRLSESVGTTADVLLNDLREATQGMYSDAELMGKAGDFMALGLAKTHDEAVRLASVAGALNMNMNQLVLTLTNQTTMRFDAIGVSVDGFKEKVKALEDAGLSAQDAFSEAFLRQAEEQIERVGSVADDTLGSFMKLEASWNNFIDSVKKGTSGPMSELITMLNVHVSEWNFDKAFKELKNAIDAAGGSSEEFIAQWKDNQNFMGWTIDADEANDILLEMSTYLTDAKTAAKWLTDPRYDIGINNFSDGLREAGDNALKASGAIISLNDAYAPLLKMSDRFYDIQGNLTEEQDKLNKLLEVDAGGGYFEGQWLSAKDLKKAIIDTQTEIDNLKGDMTSLANQAVIDMATAQLAADGIIDEEDFIEIVNLKVALGEMSRESADAMIKEFERASGVWNAMQFPDKFTTVHVNVAAGSVSYGGANIAITGDIPSPSTSGGTRSGRVIPKPGENSRATGGGIRAASGVSVAAPYWVGEGGPEPFFPAQDGRIVSNSQAMSALRNGGGGGQTVVNVNINSPITTLDRTFVERELSPIIEDILRKRRT